MDKLEMRIIGAQQNKEELDLLLADYVPFIRKQTEGMSSLGLEYDDVLSIAMMVFANCVYQYQAGKGGFLGFAKVSIRNRLIDEARKERRNAGVLYLEDRKEESFSAVYYYEKEKERQRLREEIRELTAALSEYGITIAELTKSGPRQTRARNKCLEIAKALVGNPVMKADFLETKRIPQKKLAGLFGISPKTVEKHRRYIVTLIVLLDGDYPGIRAFMPGDMIALKSRCLTEEETCHGI